MPYTPVWCSVWRRQDRRSAGLAGVAPRDDGDRAILAHVIATGWLALRATGTDLGRAYVVAQGGAIVTAGATCGVAFLKRACRGPCGSLPDRCGGQCDTGASVPWAAGMRWLLGRPEWERECRRTCLPSWCGCWGQLTAPGRLRQCVAALQRAAPMGDRRRVVRFSRAQACSLFGPRAVQDEVDVGV